MVSWAATPAQLVSSRLVRNFGRRNKGGEWLRGYPVLTSDLCTYTIMHTHGHTYPQTHMHPQPMTYLHLLVHVHTITLHLKLMRVFLFKRCRIFGISRNFLLKVDILEPGMMVHDYIPVLGRLRQKDYNFKFILSDITIFCLKRE